MVRNLIMEFKYTTTFSSVLKPLVSEDKDIYLALASLVEIGNFIPHIDTEKNVDLLPVAFNAAVVNRVNKNGDVLDSKTAIASYKDFINKPINLEHNRERIIGVILTAGFSEFGSDVPLTEEAVANITGPFNITLGGVIWRTANPVLADKIEESNDPTSSNYLKISASWELGFHDYNLILIDGDSKNIEDGSEVSEASEIESLKSNLKCLGGSGKVEKNKSIYRKVIGVIVPLGVGLTENPAADVLGVAVSQVEDEEEILEENISKIENLNVNKDIDNNVMKIQSTKDITDENLKQATASQISDLIEQELKEASEKFASEKNSVELSLKAAEEKNTSLSLSQEALRKEIEDLKSSFSFLQLEHTKILAQETFNQRMGNLESEYELNDDVRKVLAEDISTLSDESFAAYKNKMAIFLKKKGKSSAKCDCSGDCKCGKEAAKASEWVAQIETANVDQKLESSIAGVLEEVADKAEKATVDMPMTSTASEDSFYNKYKQAFNYDSFVIG